jgi:hypothetical protein
LVQNYEKAPDTAKKMAVLGPGECIQRILCMGVLKNQHKSVTPFVACCGAYRIDRFGFAALNFLNPCSGLDGNVRRFIGGHY